MAAAILLFCFQGAGRKLSTECRPVVGSRPSWRPIAGRAPKRSGDLVQRGRKNKVLLEFVHQVRAGRAPKRPGDLVQRERKNKALRGFVHQVRAGRAPKRSGDLVQRERKNKVLRGFVHQVGTGHVGARLPAKPYASVTGRQHFTLRLDRSPAELAPHCRQKLVSPLRGANILPWSAADHRPSWRSITGKTLCLRYRTPTSCPGPAAGRQKTIKKRATSVARPWCAIRGSNPGHPD